MDKEQIRKQVNTLPTIELGVIAGDGEIWERNEYGAHFKITRNKLAVSTRKGISEVQFFTLSVSGDKIGKRKVIDEFIDVLGQPFSRGPEHNIPHIEFVSWNIPN